MSETAHPHAPAAEKAGGFWPIGNIVLAALIGGFALYWGGLMFIGGVMNSAGINSHKEGDARAKSPPAETPAMTATAAQTPGPGEKLANPAVPTAAQTAPAAAATAATTPAAATNSTGAAPAPAQVAASAGAGAPTVGPVAEILIKPDITNPLAYDTKEFTVKAGQKVKLTFQNTHPTVPQPHNIVIGSIGSKGRLFELAMQMATSPDGMAKGFIPTAPEVLFHTKLLQPNTTEVLEFTAPAAGEYPYLCTFPGHAVLMNGVMKVE